VKTRPYHFKAALVFIAALLPAALNALVMENNHGNWPASWPKELEPLRSQARTVALAAGNQETVYEIPFTNRAEFERVWPVLLQLKTPGAPLTLYSTNNSARTFFHNGRAAVRIYAPSGGGPMYPADPVRTRTPETNNDRINLLFKEGRVHTLRAEPPWPPDIVSTNGELPEYVVPREENGTLRWVSGDRARDTRNNSIQGFYYRARVDLELVVDGQIVDLNAIQLPANTPIRDKRFP
jgi:hypothetical protein